MKRTELKRKPFRKLSRAETEARAKKRAAKTKIGKINERALRRMRKAIDRAAIIARDRGVCAICGVNAVVLQMWLDALPDTVHVHLLRGKYPAYGSDDRHALAVFAGRMLGRHQARARVLLGRLWGVVLPAGASLFEIDHIVPVAEGGGDDPSNLRTLCRRCHRIESAALNKRLRSRPTKGVGRGF